MTTKELNRKKKYPDTATFHFYNANPKGKITGDCTFRAICTALEQSWEQTVLEMAEMSVKTGFAINDKYGIEAYLKSKGWVKHKQPRKDDNTKYTGEQFCKEILRVGSEIDTGEDMHHIIANIGGHHIVAIISGQIFDIWNCSKKCIGNYWAKG